MPAIPFNTKVPPGKVIMPKPDAVPFKIRAKVSNLPKGREGFLQWLQATMPGAYNTVAIQAPQLFDLNNTLEAHLGDLAPVSVDPNLVPSVDFSSDSSVSTSSGSWTDTIKNIVSPLLQVYQQKKLVDVQLDRAKKNLPPLDIANYADLSSLKVGLDPSTRRTAFTVGGLFFAGAIGLGVLMLMRSRR